MKKFLLLISTLCLMLFPAISNAGNLAIGVSVSSNTLDTDGSEDVDSNGTIDATKSVSDEFMVGSIFAEYTNMMNDKFALTLGLDYIPFTADIDKRSITQVTLGAKGTTATSGTNSVSGSVENHMTFYIQPGLMLNDTMFYTTVGLARADVNGKSVSITHTDINKTQDLDGLKLGVGVKRVADNGFFYKLDYSETDYDPVSFTTSNNTKATADLDNAAFAISLGKQF